VAFLEQQKYIKQAILLIIYICLMNDATPARMWYEEWFVSSFYHRLYAGRNEEEADRFIEKLVSHLTPPAGSRILDIGCGRGRHSISLAKKGFSVTGIDISGVNIEYAKKNIPGKENPEFFVHDMRLPFRINYYDYCFNFFSSFGYFKTRREHEDCIRTIASGLKSEGLFVIDYINMHYEEERLLHNEKKIIRDTVYEIHRWYDDHHFYKRIKITDPSLSHPEQHTEQVARFSLGDFTDMLSYRQLQVKEVFGDYLLNSYDVKKSPRLIVVAKKNPSRPLPMAGHQHSPA
jgi:SAM-dependent methyltransferase